MAIQKCNWENWTGSLPPTCTLCWHIPLCHKANIHLLSCYVYHTFLIRLLHCAAWAVVKSGQYLLFGAVSRPSPNISVCWNSNTSRVWKNPVWSGSLGGTNLASANRLRPSKSTGSFVDFGEALSGRGTRVSDGFWDVQGGDLRGSCPTEWWVEPSQKEWVDDVLMNTPERCMSRRTDTT